MWPSLWQWRHQMSEECEVEGEDEVIFRIVGVVVIFTDVEEVEGRMVLSEGTAAHVKKVLL
jgi:chaperonin cofactor prefoldin